MKSRKLYGVRKWVPLEDWRTYTTSLRLPQHKNLRIHYNILSRCVSIIPIEESVNTSSTSWAILKLFVVILSSITTIMPVIYLFSVI
jgi:hypothetical protein